MKKNYKFLWYQEGFLNTNTPTIIDTTLIMLERTMYLAMLLLVKYRFQNHWSDGKHNAKVRTVKLIDSKSI